MHVLSILTAATGLIAASSAAPASTSSLRHSTKYHWDVTGWEAGCARSGCFYNFNVTGKKDGDFPKFLAYCSGEDVGYFKQCNILEGVTSKIVPSVAAELNQHSTEPDGVAAMAVSLAFLDAESG